MITHQDLMKMSKEELMKQDKKLLVDALSSTYNTISNLSYRLSKTSQDLRLSQAYEIMKRRGMK